jgi:hypothetical protein
MSPLSRKQYEGQVVAATVVFIATMLTVWPHVRTTASLSLKLLLALATLLPMFYIIGLMARRIRACDELEQRLHLIGLGVATAFVGALSLLAGFLDAAGVVALDGSSLMLVFPGLVFSYSGAYGFATRRYGGSFFSGDDLRFSAYVHAITGLALLLLAWICHKRLDEMGLDVLCAAGVALVATGVVYGVKLRQQKRIHE